MRQYGVSTQRITTLLTVLLHQCYMVYISMNNKHCSDYECSQNQVSLENPNKLCKTHAVNISYKKWSSL